MNNIILIRGDKIAFPAMPGSYSVEDYICHDLSEMMVSLGMFIPSHWAGDQAFAQLRREDIFKPADEPLPHKVLAGDKGVLIMGSAKEVNWYRVKMNASGHLGITELNTGKYGFAVISPHDYLANAMAMCVRLTNTIEETIDMFCRHHKANRRHVVIWDRAKLNDFLFDNWMPKYAPEVHAEKIAEAKRLAKIDEVATAMAEDIDKQE